MLEIHKHIILVNGNAFKFSGMLKVTHDPSDNTAKVIHAAATDVQTGWFKCSAEEFKSLITAWDDYLERTTLRTREIQGNLEHVG